MNPSIYNNTPTIKLFEDEEEAVTIGFHKKPYFFIIPIFIYKIGIKILYLQHKKPNISNWEIFIADISNKNWKIFYFNKSFVNVYF